MRQGISLPYPGLLTARERVNLESIQNKLLKYIYFKFTKDNFTKAVYITTIPKNHLILDITPVKIEEAFDSNHVFLDIGIINNIVSVVHLGVNVTVNTIILSPFTQLGNDFGKPIEIDTQIYAIINVEAANPPPTRGRGFGIITLLNLNMVEGFEQ